MGETIIINNGKNQNIRSARTHHPGHQAIADALMEQHHTTGNEAMRRAIEDTLSTAEAHRGHGPTLQELHSQGLSAQEIWSHALDILQAIPPEGEPEERPEHRPYDD